MGELSSTGENLVAQCQRVLSAKGRLKTALPGFVSRDAQIALAVAIAETIEANQVLVAEAGTGTGKTFAYLIPCLLSGKKVLVSTATKTLQDQLYSRDIPALLHALGLGLKVQNLKGRANYICRYRVQLHSEEGRFNQLKDVQELQLIRQRVGRLQEGLRSELTEIAEDSTVWPHATSTTDNCLGADCDFYQDCFLVKARRRALEADIVVINHHLFFADSQLKESGFGELLPGADVVVFDEAHQIHDIATHFHGQHFSTRQLRLLFDDLVQEWPLTDLAHQPFKSLHLQYTRIVDQLLLALPNRDERYAWNSLLQNKNFIIAWEKLGQLLAESMDVLKEVDCSGQQGLRKACEQLQELASLSQQFQAHQPGSIYWVERHKQAVTFHMTPYEVGELFSDTMARQPMSYIFTSATLTMADSFSSFTKPLSLDKARCLILPSPFDYQQQALLYLPRSLPDPKDRKYYEALLEQVIPVIEACGGRCFFLFTSHRALKLVAGLLGNRLKFPLLVQGEESKSILLARFRQLGNAVLLGTATFWEGVDVKGEALSCVIIDKLPFASPADPVTQGRMAHLRQQGLSDFHELSLPNAVLALKQGVGRLIRDENDKGVLIIADPRLTGRAYGQVIFASLPKVPRTRDQTRVLAFIEELALENETACTG
ncbi:MAG: ATP-dependent DNA helicase [Legionellaceae bacterium]|nr:ATP-dependent DNA helicase [Legionellaceae bacterium]